MIHYKKIILCEFYKEQTGNLADMSWVIPKSENYSMII